MTPSKIISIARTNGAKFVTIYEDRIDFTNSEYKLIHTVKAKMSKIPISGTKFDCNGNVISNQAHRELLCNGSPCAFFQGAFCDEIGTFNIMNNQ